MGKPCLIYLIPLFHNFLQKVFEQFVQLHLICQFWNLQFDLLILENYFLHEVEFHQDF